jgi:hypothetical protein
MSQVPDPPDALTRSPPSVCPTPHLQFPLFSDGPVLARCCGGAETRAEFFQAILCLESDNSFDLRCSSQCLGAKASVSTAAEEPLSSRGAGFFL